MLNAITWKFDLRVPDIAATPKVIPARIAAHSLKQGPQQIGQRKRATRDSTWTHWTGMRTHLPNWIKTLIKMINQS